MPVWRYSKGTFPLPDELFRLLVARPILYWDDTVVMSDKSRICLRFCGDETAACYVVHAPKDMDGILEELTEMTRVMHDHNTVNYNDKFVFTNLECNAHLQRDLERARMKRAIQYCLKLSS